MMTQANCAHAHGSSGWPVGGMLARWTLAGLLLVVLAALLLAKPQFWPVCVLLVIAPLTEEVVFRAGLQDMLLNRSVPPTISNALTAVAFGVAHAMVQHSWAGLAVVVPAIVMGDVYARWGKLTPCIVLHSLMNAGWLLWVNEGRLDLFMA